MVHVEVTQQHIDNGKRQNVTACPVYLAMKDAQIPVKEVDLYVTHDIHAVFTIDEGQSIPFDLPYECTTFIEAFDDVGPSAVKPFSFDVEIVCEYYDPA